MKQPPWPADEPHSALRPGALVRLAGKPERLRRVLRTTWHWNRTRFVYMVETSAPARFEPYWFADQLIPEGHDRPLAEPEPDRSSLAARSKSVWLLLMSRRTPYWRR